MAQSPEHGAVGAVHPEVQGPEVPVGPAGGPLRQLQGRQVPGNRPQEALRPGGVLLQTVPGGRHTSICARLQVCSTAFFKSVALSLVASMGVYSDSTTPFYSVPE